MSEAPLKPDWTNVKDDVVREIAREAEEYLKAQLQAAIAADQRAIRLVASMVTITSAVFVAGVAWLDKNPWHLPVLSAMAVASLGFGTAIVFAMISAKPTKFHFVGNTPRQWWNPTDLGRDLRLSLGEQTENYDEFIAYNDAAMRRSSKLLRRALWISAATPFVAGTILAGAWAGPTVWAAMMAAV